MLKQAHIGKGAARAIGFAVLLLALVGIISIGIFVADRLGEGSRENEKKLIATLEEYIAPVAAVDAAPFVNVAEIDNLTRLRIAAVAVLDSGSQLRNADDGRIILPVALMQQRIARLFGSDYGIKCVSFDINEMLFEYDSTEQVYYCSAGGHIKSYKPVITELRYQRGEYIANTRYVGVDDESVMTKSYVITIADKDSGYVIESVMKQ